jgi:hypothetical protein
MRGGEFRKKAHSPLPAAASAPAPVPLPLQSSRGGLTPDFQAVTSRDDVRDSVGAPGPGTIAEKEMTCRLPGALSR